MSARRFVRRLRRPAVGGAADTPRVDSAGFLRNVLKGLALVALASVVLGGGVSLASTAFVQFGGGKAAVSAQSWATRPLSYRPAACQGCHAAETAAQASNRHSGLDCETCHGPVGAHPGSDPGRVVSLTKPTSALCTTCHALTAGRPVAFRQVDPTKHFSGGVCLRCHDPHAVVAVAPPQVTHPLAGLPACTTCHAPDGLKKVPAGHELVADAVCLSCHAVTRQDR